MNYFTFKPRFHYAIQGFTKQSTIRAKAKVKVGEVFACRYWTGRPYNSLMGTLGTAECLAVCHVDIATTGFLLRVLDGDKSLHDIHDPDVFAHMEGFNDWSDLQRWFINEHHILRKPLTGVLTYWGATFQQATDATGKVQP